MIDKERLIKVDGCLNWVIEVGYNGEPFDDYKRFNSEDECHEWWVKIKSAFWYDKYKITNLDES